MNVFPTHFEIATTEVTCDYSIPNQLCWETVLTVKSLSLIFHVFKFILAAQSKGSYCTQLDFNRRIKWLIIAIYRTPTLLHYLTDVGFKHIFG